jgi:cytolysin-activating lysine-acyltransferase
MAALSLDLDKYTQTGFALALLAQSDYHRQHPLGDYFYTKGLPPLWANQVRFYLTEAGVPTAMGTWAWLSKAVEQDMHQTGRALTEDEWRSGDRLFFNDWIASYGNIRAAMRDVATHIFADKTTASIRRNKDGSIRKINRWTGMALRQQQQASQ